MSTFREDIFLRALIEREHDARLMSQLFRPEWLAEAALQPVLAEIFEFLHAKHLSPSIDTLRDIFASKDREFYTNRMKKILDGLEEIKIDLSLFVRVLEQAKNVAITRSLQELVQSETFKELQRENKGADQLLELHSWMQQFSNSPDAIEADIKQGIDTLVTNHDWDGGEVNYIKTGIPLIDDWSGGSLAKKQLAILMAPSGNGKSIFLGIIAHNIARQLDKRVLYITNELTMDEVAERFLCKMTGTPLSQIKKDPSTGLDKLKRHWEYGLNKYLRIIEVRREINADYIESKICEYRDLYGWVPDVVIVDYMERMCPNSSQIPRDKTWLYLGQIAKDLVWASKRQNFLVWTAVQTNRSGFKEKDQDATQMQGSIMQLQEATLVVAMRKMGHMVGYENFDIMQFKPIKVRHARDEGKQVFLKAELGRMKITDERVSAEDVVFNTKASADKEDIDQSDAPLKKGKQEFES